MEYNGINFEALVASPGCGKSYLCDKYPNLFVDVDELRLKTKYYVPENITREELERDKGQRSFKKRYNNEEFIEVLNKKLDEHVKNGKVLIAAPHAEAIEYLVNRNIKFCFVYANKNIKNEIVDRFINRNNPKETVKEYEDNFDEFYHSNKKENKTVVHYEFGENEYLEDIIKKFGYKFT